MIDNDSGANDLIRLSEAASSFNNERVSKQSLATYAAQARRRGWVAFGTESIEAVQVGRYWYVRRNDLEHVLTIYRRRQANPELRREYVDSLEYRGWVTTTE